MNTTNAVKKITLAASISAICVVFLLIYKLCFGVLDSFVFLVLPIPIAYYSYRFDSTYSILPVITTSLLSMIFIEPLHTLFFVLPGTLIGYIYGLLAKRNNKTILKLGVLFCLELIFTLLTDLIFSKLLFNYEFIDDTMIFIDQICNTFKIDNSLIKPIIVGIIPSIFIISSIMNTLVIYFGLDILLVRFKQKSRFEMARPSIKNRLNKVLACLFIFNFILSLILTYFCYNKTNFFYYLWAGILNITIILALYVIYQAIIYKAIKAAIYKSKIEYIISIISIFIFPFYMIVVGLIFSFKKTANFK